MRKLAFSALFLAVLALIILFSCPARAVCGKQASISDLRATGAQGEQAFAQMDLTSLLKLSGRAKEEILPCLQSPLKPQDAAVFHRLMALEAFTRHNDNRVIAEFHAARRLEPGYKFAEDVASGDHPLLALYERSAEAEDGNAEPVFAPENGYAIVDGVRNAARMSATPVIIQVYGADNAWVETRYIQPGEKLPVWGKNLFGVKAEDLGIDTTPTWRKSSFWYTTAVITAVLAGGSYGWAMKERSSFDDFSTPDSDLSGHRDRANAFGWSAVITAGLATILTCTGVGLDTGFLGPGVNAPATGVAP